MRFTRFSVYIAVGMKKGPPNVDGPELRKNGPARGHKGRVLAVSGPWCDLDHERHDWLAWLVEP